MCRKTGVTLPDNGVRDQFGFEDPNIFSSPEKEPNDASRYDRETPEEEDEQDMDLDDGMVLCYILIFHRVKMAVACHRSMLTYPKIRIRNGTGHYTEASGAPE